MILLRLLHVKYVQLDTHKLLRVNLRVKNVHPAITPNQKNKRVASLVTVVNMHQKQFGMLRVCFVLLGMTRPRPPVLVVYVQPVELKPRAWSAIQDSIEVALILLTFV